MKIGIVGAMAQEVEILSQLMTDKKETIVKFLSNFSLIMTAEFVLQLKIFCNFIAKFDLIKWH